MGAKKNVDKTTKEKIVQNYLNGMGQISSGKEFNISGYIVKKILQEYKIPIRDFAHAATVSNINRAYNINHDYFKTESSNMAYILGFLASDGTVRKNSNQIKLTLATKDREIIEKIKEELHFDGNINDYISGNGFFNSTIEFTSKEIKEDLKLYNITPQKTFTFNFPQRLNKKYWIDFIRGYFDGDGCISTAGSAIRFQICSATQNVLENIVNFLYEEYSIPKVKLYIRKGLNNLYYIQYSTNPTKDIFKILYYPNCLCLDRKYKIFQNLCNEINIQETTFD